MNTNVKPGNIELEFEVPFPVPESKKHSTKVLALNDGRRYVLDCDDGRAGGGDDADSIFVGRVLNDGELDKDFNGFGWKAERLENMPTMDSAGLLLREGGGVVAGVISATQLGLVCFRADGTLDPTFGNGGKIVHSTQMESARVETEKVYKPTPANTPDAGKWSAASTSAALVPGLSGKFYALTGTRLSYSRALIRCAADGKLDQKFNETGFLYINHPSLRTDAMAVASTPDGGAVVAGTLGDRAQGMRGFFSRYKPDGKRDEKFGERGFAIFDSLSFGVPQEDLFQMEFTSLTALAGGGFAASGYLSARNPSRDYGVLVCIDSDGKPLRSFNGGMPVSFQHPDGLEADFRFGGVAEQHDGKIVVGGSVADRSSGYKNYMLVTRYLPSGQLDPVFAGKGWLMFLPFENLKHNVSYIASLSIDANQKIMISGDSGLNNNFSSMVGVGVQISS